ncbi:hypothetical protein CRG98_033557 [Punica granatum]|uniref:Bet v I/Major latex protein domain-containing protein n=1 Tax=Punica granatum TaxID=22663 RepID=A0A2I0IPU6_PUNGR|nr:hypothetical protein CRG98_033557 [Punica granatum]
MEVVCPFKMFLIPICRERVFKGLVIDAHNLIPELAPHIMKSIKTVHGDGGPGTIRECTYNEESGYSGLTSTLRIDILDAENFVYRHTIIKGVVYGRMHSVVHEMKFESLGHDKCICKVSTEYHLKEEIDTEHLKWTCIYCCMGGHPKCLKLRIDAIDNEILVRK